MSSATIWSTFRKFRTIILSLVSFLCLIWAIIIAIYMAKNWSSYDGGQRGFLFGLLALDFISSIFIYLMVVVKYRFWPDAARTVILIGLHAAATVSFMVFSPRFPCNAFGSTTTCHRLTKTIVVGFLVISSLLIVYGIVLPLMAFIRPPIPPKAEDDPEEMPAPQSPNTDEEPVVEKRKSHASSGSRAWLLKNQEGMSPELNPSVLPHSLLPGAGRGHSHTSSSLSSLHFPQRTSYLIHEADMEGERGHLGAPRFESPRSEPSPLSSPTRAVHAPFISAADRDINLSGSSAASSADSGPSRPSSPHEFPLPNRFREEITEENRVSLVSTSSYDSAASRIDNPIVTRTISEAPRRSATLTAASSSSSVYSQPSASSHWSSATTKAPFDTQRFSNVNRDSASSGSQSSLPRTPGQDSVHSMMASVHNALVPVDEGESLPEGYLSPPLTATPSASADSAQTTFEFHLSDSPQISTTDAPAYIVEQQRERTRQDSSTTIMSPPPRPGTHVRNDSVASNVDMDEWKRLVMSAAGKS